MHLLDEYIAKLEAIEAPLTKRPDFDQFWSTMRDEAKRVPLNVKGGPVTYPIRSIEARDLTFAGLDGTPVRTWLVLPPEAKTRKVPAVVFYHGASGSRGTPVNYLHWTSMGVAVIAMDFRMQGGLTGSNTGFTGGGRLYWLSMGVADRDTSYLTHVWSDALRAIRLARETPEIDGSRIAVDGGSQGGGMAIAMAAVEQSVALCMADVPSSCWFEKRVMDRSGGMSNIADFIREHPELLDAVMTTLSYFDNINHAANIRCPVLVSYGTKDPVCPPECVYAAYNRITAEKQIVGYPFAEHEGGRALHQERKMEFLREKFRL